MGLGAIRKLTRVGLTDKIGDILTAIEQDLFRVNRIVFQIEAAGLIRDPRGALIDQAKLEIEERYQVEWSGAWKALQYCRSRLSVLVRYSSIIRRILNIIKIILRLARLAAALVFTPPRASTVSVLFSRINTKADALVKTLETSARQIDTSVSRLNRMCTLAYSRLVRVKGILWLTRDIESELAREMQDEEDTRPVYNPDLDKIGEDLAAIEKDLQDMSDQNAGSADRCQAIIDKLTAIDTLEQIATGLSRIEFSQNDYGQYEGFFDIISNLRDKISGIRVDLEDSLGDKLFESDTEEVEDLFPPQELSTDGGFTQEVLQEFEQNPTTREVEVEDDSCIPKEEEERKEGDRDGDGRVDPVDPNKDVDGPEVVSNFG